MIAGLLAGSVAVGAGQLAAGLTGPSGSPVVVVGQLQIDYTPPWLKNFAIAEFGGHDKEILVGGILAVLAVFAAAFGVLAIRQQARLAAVPGIDTWRQWAADWDATPGGHLIEARATDRTGYTQTPAAAPPEPNGATGYPSLTITVT
ncbi:MAG TPA: hypothetical protein VGI31_00025 [Streptosporangiaceae bacterium]|jgi:hypothetical protein